MKPNLVQGVPAHGNHLPTSPGSGATQNSGFSPASSGATRALHDPTTARAGIEMSAEMSEISIWNDYWHFDRLGSFDDLGETNYREEVAAGWRSFFDSLPDGASILDLCTGNGAIAVMAAEAGRRGGKDFRIVAVDAADINPYLYVKKHRDELAAIEFRPATPIESLPWPDASFDAVVSQYGIEYSDLSLSISELARVVAPTGTARLILHAAEGAVVQRSNRGAYGDRFPSSRGRFGGQGATLFTCCRGNRTKHGPVGERPMCSPRELGCFPEGAARNRPAHCHRSRPKDAAKFRQDAGRVVSAPPASMTSPRRSALSKESAPNGEIIGAALSAQIAAAVTRKQRAELAGRLKRSGAREVKESDQMVSGGLIGHCIEARF